MTAGTSLDGQSEISHDRYQVFMWSLRTEIQVQQVNVATFYLWHCLKMHTCRNIVSTCGPLIYVMLLHIAVASCRHFYRCTYSPVENKLEWKCEAVLREFHTSMPHSPWADTGVCGVHPDDCRCSKCIGGADNAPSVRQKTFWWKYVCQH